MMTRGSYHMVGEKVVVTELPIGRGLLYYENWLKELIEEKIIKDYSVITTETSSQVTIVGFPNPSMKRLKLNHSYGLSNIVLLDLNEIPVTYRNVWEVLAGLLPKEISILPEEKGLEID